MCTGEKFFIINITNKIGFLINFHGFFFHFLNIQELRLKEQEELELAIALSLDQAEQNKTKSSPKSSPEHSSKNTNERSVEQEDDTPQLPTLNSDENSDLQKYLHKICRSTIIEKTHLKIFLFKIYVTQLKMNNTDFKI